MYQAADPFCSARITVPVLWDKKTRTIVSNDSWSIVKMLAAAFPSLSAFAAPPALYPEAERVAIEALHAELKANLLNGVYRAGINLVRGNPEAAAKGRADVFASLDKWNATLASRRFLTGATIRAVDIRLVMTLLRYDSSYFDAFGMQLVDAEQAAPSTPQRGNVLTGDGYPHLKAYVRDVYQSGVGPTVHWESFNQYFRWTVGHPADAPLPDISRIVASAEAPCPERAALA